MAGAPLDEIPPDTVASTNGGSAKTRYFFAQVDRCSRTGRSQVCIYVDNSALMRARYVASFSANVAARAAVDERY